MHVAGRRDPESCRFLGVERGQPLRAFYLVGSGAELEGCVVGGKAGVPPFEVLAKTAVDDSIRT